MSDTALAISTPAEPLNRYSAPKSAQGRVTGRLKRALDMMIWDGIRDNDAAVANRITVTALRIALNRPHVRSYYRGQLQVLREREGSLNIHALVEVRDQKTNHMARVQAIKVLEQLNDDPQATASRSTSPGFVIIVAGNAPSTTPSTTLVDVTPNKPAIIDE